MLKNKSLRLAVKQSNADKFLNPDESICVLNALLVGFEFMVCLDLVAETTLYRQSLKERVNGALKELQKMSLGLGEIVNVDDEAMFTYLEHKKQLMKRIAPLKPELKGGLNHVLDEFFNAPELTIHRLGIKIIDRDK
jgi:hypothetical protein